MEERIEVEVVELFPSIVLLLLTIMVIAGILLYLKIRRNYASRNTTDLYLEKLALLSSRERQVFDEILKYKSLKEIAETLYIEVSTVKSHANKIYKLFGVKNKRELLAKLLGFHNA